LAWEDATTQLVLRVPQDSRESILLELRDRQDVSKAAERLAAVTKFEAAERRERLEAGKPFKRLPRKLEQFPLGAERAAILKYLPQDRQVLKRDLPDGVMATINSQPPKDRAYMARQIITRFNAQKRLAWVRIRYEPVPTATPVQKGTDWTRRLLEQWQGPGGVVAPIASPLLARSRDLPQQQAPIVFHWQDDLTDVTFARDSDGIEVTLQDRPETGAGLGALSYLPRGPEARFPGLSLGMTRTEVESRLGPQVEDTEGKCVVWAPRGAFDAVTFWFDKENRIRKIAARHRQAEASKTEPKELERLLHGQWGAELRSVGWPTRRHASPQGVLQYLVWFDDVTRYCLYWAESEQSPPRLWSEWQEDAN
jgi:hypothetical protein